MFPMATPLKALFFLALVAFVSWGGFRIAQTSLLRRFWSWKASLPVAMVVMVAEIGVYTQVLPGEENPVLVSAVVAVMFFTAGLFSGFRPPFFGES